MEALMAQRPTTSYGSNRSMVRKIATCLPIHTGERIFIQLPHIAGSHPSSPSSSMGGMFDITSLLKDPEFLLSTVPKFKLGPIKEEEEIRETKEENEEQMNGRVEEKLTEEDRVSTTKRISSLEAELARLKAQIATYALSETEGYNMQEAPPPPPPPPPVPPPASSATSISTNSSSSTSTTVATEATPSRPPLTSVLKDIGSVKLRTVNMERSPGGTPLRPKRTSLTQEAPSMDDPGSIIAHALRKKFSHRIFQDSPDKENLDRSECSFGEFDSPVSSAPPKKLFESPHQQSS